MIVWAQGECPRLGAEAVEQRSVPSLHLCLHSSHLCTAQQVLCVLKNSHHTNVYWADNREEQQKLSRTMALSLGYDYFPCARSIQQQKKGKNFIFSNTRPSSAGQGSCEHFYFYFQASSSDVSLLLVSVSESSHSAMQVLLHGENRLELRPCKKPFFTNPFLRSCSVLVWNSLSSSSVSGRQLSSFSGYSCHPIAFNNLCSASREWDRTSLSSTMGRESPFWRQPCSPFSFGSGVWLPSNLSPSSLSQSLLWEQSPLRSSFRVFRNSLFLSVVRRVNLVRREELISIGGVVLEGLSLGELRTTPAASTTGLVTETGLVKADSRLEESDPDLCSILLAFHALGLEGGGAGLGTKFL